MQYARTVTGNKKKREKTKPKGTTFSFPEFNAHGSANLTFRFPGRLRPPCRVVCPAYWKGLLFVFLDLFQLFSIVFIDLLGQFQRTEDACVSPYSIMFYRSIDYIYGIFITCPGFPIPIYRASHFYITPSRIRDDTPVSNHLTFFLRRRSQMNIVIARRAWTTFNLKNTGDTGYISHIRGMYTCGSSLVYVYQTVRQTEADRKTRGTGTGTTSDTCTYLLFDWKPNLDKIDRFIQLSYSKNVLVTYLLCMGIAPK